MERFTYPIEHREKLRDCSDPINIAGPKFHVHIDIEDERLFSSLSSADIGALALEQLNISLPRTTQERRLLKSSPGIACVKCEK